VCALHFAGPRSGRMLKPSEPEALIYEPQPNGSMRLVGVEFIVFAADGANMRRRRTGRAGGRFCKHRRDHLRTSTGSASERKLAPTGVNKSQ
jgi:hypothetical protein